MTIRRIVVSGGPGAGKTSVWRAIASTYGQRVLPVPEVATLLFSHVFPPVQNEHERRAVQRAIFAVQQNLERIYEQRLEPGQVLLCDRGLPDGAGYWPEGPAAFFEAMQSDWQQELARYEAVLFLESAAVGGLSITEGNAVRREDLAGAVRIDTQLRSVWAPHPQFTHVAHELDFAVKLANGKAAMSRFLS